MTGPSPRRTGTTLIELLVVLAILAALAGVTTLAVRRTARIDPADAWTMIAAARRYALTTGVETTIVVRHGGVPFAVALYPDGRALADPALALDPLTGRRIHAAH